MQASDDSPYIESVNIEDNILCDSQIELDFSMAILNSTNYGYIKLIDSNGQQLSLVKTLKLDKLIIKPYTAFVDGECYTLTIPANALSSRFGVSADEVSYTFTYSSNLSIELVETNISNGQVLTNCELDLEFVFTTAQEGDNFSDVCIKSGRSWVDGFEVSLVGNVLKFTGSLDYGSYTIYIPAGALKDSAGGTNELIQISFEIVKRLELTSSTISDGDERLDENTKIELTFSGATVGAEFENITLVSSDGESVEISAVLSDGVLAIEHPTLEQGKTYTLVIPENALCDEAGNGNEQIVYTFTTYAPVQLMYSSVENGADSVAKEPVFRFEYNGSFTLDSSKIEISDGVAFVDFSAELRGNILYVTPVKLSANTSYTLTLAKGLLTDERDAESEETVLTFATLCEKERFEWTEEEFNLSVKEWKELGLNNNGFTNNAILNDLNDTTVENWLRVTAQDGYSSSNSIGLAGNYWGTTDETMIGKQIVDFDDFQTLADIVVGEYLTKAPESVWPFVVDAYLLNSNGERADVVGNEKVTFVIVFNRDMDMAQNLRVRFGSSTPYAEYEVTGAFVSTRQWEGTYTLKTTIENGVQYLNIENGRASDDKYMVISEHVGRFMFTIDTTSAQALIMQGEACDTGIKLTWEQDDFDTLAGYNVYRSDKENGEYVRLNDYVLSPDENYFFDDTVEPGQVYYYNFTVVKTDLTESTPSGKISIMSMDTMAPNIYHSPVRTAYTNSNLVISATITDNLMVASATIYYRTVGDTEWKSVIMTALNSRFSGIISAENLSTDGLEYYISATDGVSNTYKGSAENPYTVTVKLAIDQNSLGDVDGDGVITTKDALMLLQAANGLLNLTSEQFLRADINGDGELSASEALRILQYVSGKVTTIV
jgi:hypothetical protein